MKTREFFNNVKKLGYRVHIPKNGCLYDYIEIHGYGKSDNPFEKYKEWVRFATLRTDLQYTLQINTGNFLFQETDYKNDLYKILAEYDMTPENERNNNFTVDAYGLHFKNDEEREEICETH